VGAGEIGVLLDQIQAHHRRAGREADGVQGARLGDERIGPLRRGGMRLLRQLERGPAFAALQPVGGERIEQRGVARVLLERGVERRAPLVGVAILQPREAERSLRIRGRCVERALHRPQRHAFSLVCGPAPLQRDGQVLLRARVRRMSARRGLQLVDGVERLSRCRRFSASAFDSCRGGEGRRAGIGNAGRLRQLDQRRILAVGDAQAEARTPGGMGDLEQHEVVAGLQGAREVLLIEARRMQRRVFVHQLSVQPHADGAAGAEVEEGRLRLGRAQNSRRVQGHVAARIDRRAQVDESVGRVSLGQRAPGDVVLLAAVDGLGIKAVLLGGVLGEEPGAAFVLEGPDHAPGADGGNLLESGDRLRELAESQRHFAAHLEREGAHVRPRPGRAARLVERREQGSEVSLLLSALVQPEEVGHGLRFV
jgi:hypothetical protein